MSFREGLFFDRDAARVPEGAQTDPRAAVFLGLSAPDTQKYQASLKVLEATPEQDKIDAIKALIEYARTNPEGVGQKILDQCQDPRTRVRAAAFAALPKLHPHVNAAELLKRAVSLRAGLTSEEDKGHADKAIGQLCVFSPKDAVAAFEQHKEQLGGFPIVAHWAAAEKLTTLTEAQKVLRHDFVLPDDEEFKALSELWHGQKDEDMEGDKELPPSTVLRLKEHPADDLTLGELEMRFKRYGDCSVQAEEGYVEVKFQFTRCAYAAKQALTGKKVRGKELEISFGPQAIDHATRHIKKKEERATLFQGVLAARAMLGGDSLSGSATLRPGVVKELIAPDEPVSRWSEAMTFEEQLEDFAAAPREDDKAGILLRYIVIGDAPHERAVRSSLPGNLSGALVDIIPVQCFGREVLFVTFRSIGAATDAFRIFTDDRGWNCSFAPPRFCSNRLWIGNVAGVTEEHLHECLLRFGVTGVKVVPHSKCAYAEFSSSERAIEARNHVFGLLTPAGHRLNVDFCEDNSRKRGMRDGRAQDRDDALPPVIMVSQPKRARLSDEGRDDRRERDQRRDRERDDRDKRRDPRGDRDEPKLKKKDDRREPQVQLSSSIFKLEEWFCDVVATLVSGEGSEDWPKELRIDQRTKREHCITHIERSRSVRIWHLAAENRRDTTGYVELADYLVEKDRVGIARGRGNSYVYIAPPERNFLEALRLAPTKYMVAIQVEGQRS